MRDAAGWAARDGRPEMGFEEIRMGLGFAFLGFMFYAGLPKKSEWF
jgi:hypothetical protein